MTRAVVWSVAALDDLDAAVAYIGADNPTAAERVAASIRLTGNRLGEMATGKPGRNAGVYEKLVPGVPYVLAYALHAYPELREAVVILRVIHGARDWPQGRWPE